MAKAASLFNGTTAGKVGEVVFFRANGQQRARQYVAQVNDAKSESQVAQRVTLAPCIIAYRHFKALLQDSFPSSSIGVSGYNAFVGLNKASRKAYFTKALAGTNTYSFAQYQMSKGILVSLPNGVFAANTYSIKVPGGTGTGLADFVTEFKAAYPDATSLARFVYARMWLDETETWQYKTKILSFGLMDEEFPEGVAYTAGKIVITIPFSGTADSAAVVLIRTQKDSNGKVDVSSQQMVNTDPGSLRYGTYTNEAAYQAAIDSYGYNANSVL